MASRSRERGPGPDVGSGISRLGPDMKETLGMPLYAGGMPTPGDEFYARGRYGY